MKCTHGFNSRQSTQNIKSTAKCAARQKTRKYNPFSISWSIFLKLVFHNILMYLFIISFIHSFIHSFINKFIHSFIHSCVRVCAWFNVSMALEYFAICIVIVNNVKAGEKRCSRNVSYYYYYYYYYYSFIHLLHNHTTLARKVPMCV